MNINAIPSWYIQLARTLRLQMVYPAIMVIGSVALAIVYMDALSGFLSGAMAVAFFALAKTLNNGYGRGNVVTRALYSLCVFLEIPHHGDGHAGLAYFFLFIITGVLCTLIQLSYLLSLAF